MVNFKKLSDKAKDVVEKRGGTESVKGDAQELTDIAKSKGSFKDKAMAAKDAIADPGAKGPDPTAADGQHVAPADRPETPPAK